MSANTKKDNTIACVSPEGKYDWIRQARKGETGENVDPYTVRQVVGVDRKNGASLIEVIELLCMNEVAMKHRQLCAKVAGTTVDNLYKKEKDDTGCKDGYKPGDMLPGATFGHAKYMDVSDYKQNWATSLQPREVQEWGQHMTTSFYTNVMLPERDPHLQHSLCGIPHQLAMKYKGVGRFLERNVVDHSNERARGFSCDPGEHGKKTPSCAYATEIQNAGFFMEDCKGHLACIKGKRPCECSKELICSPGSYQTFPFNSPLARLSRQWHARCELVNAMLQSDQMSPYGADHYLASMYSDDESESHLRFILLPIGMTDIWTMAFVRVAICQKTFCRLFCLSKGQDEYLFRMSKEQQPLESMASIHRSEMKQEDLSPWRAIPALETIHPQAAELLTLKGGTNKRKRMASQKDLFGFDFKGLVERGVSWHSGPRDEKTEEQKEDNVSVNEALEMVCTRNYNFGRPRNLEEAEDQMKLLKKDFGEHTKMQAIKKQARDHGWNYNSATRRIQGKHPSCKSGQVGSDVKTQH